MVGGILCWEKLLYVVWCSCWMNYPFLVLALSSWSLEVGSEFFATWVRIDLVEDVVLLERYIVKVVEGV